MSGQLLVELNDLRIAEKELTRLLARLQADEQQAAGHEQKLKQVRRASKVNQARHKNG